MGGGDWEGVEGEEVEQTWVGKGAGQGLRWWSRVSWSSVVAEVALTEVGLGCAAQERRGRRRCVEG